MSEDHWEGFEKERLFHDLLNELEQAGAVLNAKHLRLIISRIAPDYFKDLFERKSCVRKLRYKGWCWSQKEQLTEEDEYFKVGEIYESVDFNGGTYTMKECGKLIGCGWFERVYS